VKSKSNMPSSEGLFTLRPSIMGLLAQIGNRVVGHKYLRLGRQSVEAGSGYGGGDGGGFGDGDEHVDGGR
jgi:hypothetical protein